MYIAKLNDGFGGTLCAPNIQSSQYLALLGWNNTKAIAGFWYNNDSSRIETYHIS